MIRTSLSFLPLLYAGALLAGVLVLWLVGSWRRARRRRREWRALGQCRLFAAWVRPASWADLWKCPTCQALNERVVAVDL